MIYGGNTKTHTRPITIAILLLLLNFEAFGKKSFQQFIQNYLFNANVYRS